MQPICTLLRSRQIVMITKQQPKVRKDPQVRTYRISLSQKVGPLLYMLLALVVERAGSWKLYQPCQSRA